MPARFVRAPTSDLSGSVQVVLPQVLPQDGTTPFCPRDRYGVAKLYANRIVVSHRAAQGRNASKGPFGEAEINIGMGNDITTRIPAAMIVRVAGFNGWIARNVRTPDGTTRTCMDAARLAELGCQAGMGVEDGLRRTYGWFRRQEEVGT